MLEIEDLWVSTTQGASILKGFTLRINPGEIHVLMGPNGTGKSTLAKVLAGHPDYEIHKGKIFFCGEDLLKFEPEERAQKGLFMSFQYPPEIPGVSNLSFLQNALKALQKAQGMPECSQVQFDASIDSIMQKLDMRSSFLTRNVNEGFSGGEKKRNEVLQLSLLNPKFAVLDETDSGLDIDAIRIVSSGIQQWMQPEKGLLLITHYKRLLDYIKPHFIHVMIDGKIQHSGEASLADYLEKEGYDFLLKPEEVKA